MDNAKEQAGMAAPRMPEFGRVLASFRKSNCVSFELTDRITYLVGRLKPVQAYETKSSNTEKVMEQAGVISEFYELNSQTNKVMEQAGVISEFYELNSQTNKVNNQLQIIMQHLESLLD